MTLNSIETRVCIPISFRSCYMFTQTNSLLDGMPGVIRKHDFFTEYCLHEEDVGKGRLVYNGKRTRRICLVLDCLSPNDFTSTTADLINLQVGLICI